ncbi:hypothetical protein HK101_004993 [Irineochytrium annulatum]|nr:hypothetical protein HK101_004993 [Irineochytrium annulatum]
MITTPSALIAALALASVVQAQSTIQVGTDAVTGYGVSSKSLTITAGTSVTWQTVSAIGHYIYQQDKPDLCVASTAANVTISVQNPVLANSAAVFFVQPGTYYWFADNLPSGAPNGGLECKSGDQGVINVVAPLPTTITAGLTGTMTGVAPTGGAGGGGNKTTTPKTTLIPVVSPVWTMASSVPYVTFSGARGLSSSIEIAVLGLVAAVMMLVV